MPEGDELARDVRDLQRRVDALERRLGMATAQPAAAPAPAAPRPAVRSDLLPILGRALLGLAGAYLLRALTESDALPARGGVGAGLVYALLWLIWAARTPPERRLETAVHSLTSALVLSPLLWEATLRFHAITTWTAGALLLLFTVFGLAVSWRKNLMVAATIATLAGLGTAAGLLIATHDVLPFTLVFLAIGAAVEISACLNHYLSERWLTAAAADLSVLLATWLVTNPRGLPESYVPISHASVLAAQIALLAIWLASTIVRTLFRGYTVTGFEIAQCVAAFAVVMSGGLTPAIGALALVCGAACYIVTFVLVHHGRNFYTYSTFGMLLTLAGTWILLPTFAAAVWQVLALACAGAGSYFGRVTLQVHGALYILLAAGVSGALRQAAAFLLGSANWPGEQTLALAVCTAVALLCYMLGRGSASLPFRLGVAATGAWLASAISAGALTGAYHAIFGAGASHAYCATLRTSVLAVTALLLAWAGARWKRAELSRLLFPAMLLGAYRLAMEDFRQERKAALVVSLLIYGCALMALPKLRQATD